MTINDAINQAAAEAEADAPHDKTRRWLLNTTSGTLCTTSAHREMAGYPFGSIVPFALTPEGKPFVFIANIAAHTKNLKADARGSLFVHQPHMEGDPQSGWRVTVMGKWRMVEDAAEIQVLAPRYQQRVPRAVDYENTHGFRFWVMEDVEKVRYIGGFGKICWIDGARVLVDPQGEGLDKAARGAIEHMNEDHSHNLVEMCTGLAGFTPEKAEMTGLSRDGFCVRTVGPDQEVFFPFGHDITASTLRMAIIGVLKQARAQQSA